VVSSESGWNDAAELMGTASAGIDMDQAALNPPL
jgi:hypothetical protein